MSRIIISKKTSIVTEEVKLKKIATSDNIIHLRFEAENGYVYIVEIEIEDLKENENVKPKSEQAS